MYCCGFVHIKHYWTLAYVGVLKNANLGRCWGGSSKETRRTGRAVDGGGAIRCN